MDARGYTLTRTVSGFLRTAFCTVTILAAGSCNSDNPSPVDPDGDVGLAVEASVARLSITQYKAAVFSLSMFGDRTQGTQGNRDALDWLEAELESYGYTNVERHAYTYQGQPRENIYATLVGKTIPGEMYIVSAHMDGRGGGQAADDDASGCAVILELARVLASSDFESERSVRFIFWNNEETGLNGSAAYAQSRAPLRGIENPVGSGHYPEPQWLGVIQHDMMMFDHGMPPGVGLPPSAVQSPNADIDVEYQATSTMAGASQALAQKLGAANVLHAADYPAEISGDMNNTDSKSFQNLTASISLRESRRIAEIGNGANPNWHKASDLYATYSDLDFLLGFNSAQTTLGAIGQLIGLRIK